MQNIAKICSADSISLMKSLSIVLENVSKTSEEAQGLLNSLNQQSFLNDAPQPLSDSTLSRLVLSFPDLFELGGKHQFGNAGSDQLISQILSLGIESEVEVISNWSLNSVLEFDFRPDVISSYSFLKSYVNNVFSGYDHIKRAAGHGPSSFECQDAHLNSRNWGTFR
jgi:hypothetical protein